VLLLAERAALAADGYPQMPYGCAPYPGANPGMNPNAGQAPAADPGTAIVPSRTEDFGNGPGGGQL